jgi:hypothetical protein
MAPPRWKAEEGREAYNPVEKHSDGMVSFTYRPPSNEDLEALKDTKTYRSLFHPDEEQPASDTVGSGPPTTQKP